MRIFFAVIFVFGVFGVTRSNPKQDFDESAVNEFIDSLPEEAFQDLAEDGSIEDGEFDEKLDELLENYKFKEENKQEGVKPINIITQEDEQNEKAKEMEDVETLEDVEVDTRPALDPSIDPKDVYPSMSDEEFKLQEQRDMDEIEQRDEPEEEEQYDEATLKQMIEDAFREQSFDVSGIDGPVEKNTAESDSKMKESFTEEDEAESVRPKKEYTGSDIEEVKGLNDEYNNLHEMESMGQMKDPYDHSFEEYDRKRKLLADEDED